MEPLVAFAIPFVWFCVYPVACIGYGIVAVAIKGSK